MASERTAKLAETNFWDELIALRDRQREQSSSGVQVIKRIGTAGRDQPAGADALVPAPGDQGHGAAVFMFFQQEIPPGSRSGGSSSRAAR